MLAYIIQNFQSIYFTSIYGGVLLFLTIEYLQPRIVHSEIFFFRWTNNLILSVLGFYISAVLTPYIFLYLGAVQELTPSIILTLINAEFIYAFALLFVLMELASYLQHRAFHHFRILWKFHAVHHTDTEIDATTTHRHHPLEVIFSAVVLGCLYLFLQSPPEVFISYSLLRIAVSIFSHSNVRLPKKLDQVLRLIVITPDFHRMHHASNPRYTDSNYGSITPWLDHLFGTSTRIPYEAQVSLETGLEYLREQKDSRLDNLLLLPWLNSKFS